MAVESRRDDRREAGRRRRVFFALWPDEPTRAALLRSSRAAVEQSQGRATPHENLHMTLAFVGEVREEELAEIRQISPPRIGAFELTVDTLGYRKRARLLWAAPATVPPALLALESRLWSRLDDLGIDRDRRAYRPHVTLARRARNVVAEFEPVRWAVADFVLVDSRLGPPNSTYGILERWPLG